MSKCESVGALRAPGESRVSARLGRAGENRKHFEHPQWKNELRLFGSTDDSYFQTASGLSFAAGLPPLMCSSRIVATSASVTFEYQVPSG